MPTTGGLDPDGVYHPTWSPAGRDAKVDPPGKKAEARRLTRVRRLRYYPVRVVGRRSSRSRSRADAAVSAELDARSAVVAVDRVGPGPSSA